jgi:predicted O-methyltransferase YrrM
MRRWNVLAELINENDYRYIAEIGVCKGDTALPLLQNCEIDKYYAVDPAFHSKFLDMDLSIYPQLELYHMTSKEAAMIIKAKLDLVFIDALHDEARVDEDIQLWAPKVRPGGVVCGHDYENKRFPGVKVAVERYFGAENVKTAPVKACMLWIYHVPKKR